MIVAQPPSAVRTSEIGRDGVEGFTAEGLRALTSALLCCATIIEVVSRRALGFTWLSRGLGGALRRGLPRELACVLLLALALTSSCTSRTPATVRALPTPRPTPQETPLPSPSPTPDTGRASPAWRAFVEGRASLTDFENFGPARQPVSSGRLDHELLSAAVFYYTNAERAHSGRPLLAWCDPLGRAAERHSSDMAQQGFFSHVHPNDASRRTFVDRLRSEGIPLVASAENIAQWRVSEGDTYLGFARRIVGSWMDSSVHRTNILARDYAYLGVGVCESDSTGGKVYATQDFSAVTCEPEPAGRKR